MLSLGGFVLFAVSPQKAEKVFKHFPNALSGSADRPQPLLPDVAWVLDRIRQFQSLNEINFYFFLDLS